MKKKVLISLLGIFVIIILCGVALFIYVNQVENVTVRTGKYFDESGKELGVCKIESKLYNLADVPQDTTYYYALNEESAGYCKGSSTGCSISTSGPADHICSPVSLQASCDNKIYPYLSPDQGATAKYKCVID